MHPEQRRHEQYIAYSAYLKERFAEGALAELQDKPQWVLWRAELEDGKQKKVPYNPNYKNARASVKIPKSWGTLDQALTNLETGNFSGLGFMLTPPLVLIDLDNSFDRKTGTITSPQAQEIMQEISTYYEASPYKGIHGLVFVEKPIKSLHTETLELYAQDRFTTITTDHLAGTPQSIQYRTEEVHALYNRFAPAVPDTGFLEHRGGVGIARLTQLPPEAANDRLLQALLSGDMSSVGNDHHRADWILLMKLLHWTGDDIALAKHLFLASPLGQREKAQDTEGKGKRGNSTYLDRTIERIRANRRNPPQKR